ncbi:TonB-dependent receptor [Nguyenibacter sp. L1]|uniref:TonB-dependent receptor n=1 Tax=Nguyenibacter sp. L1 TaxID=3049350 RepID=UPI002B4A0415|nr:TonB-dependent receptor [Nguyenibacter sp. L1]WRH88807.1 TonB-dependent receptor [Nguyenibacter sp. L1]
MRTRACTPVYRRAVLCLATALAPIGAPLLHAQDLQPAPGRHQHKPRHHGKHAAHAKGDAATATPGAQVAQAAPRPRHKKKAEHASVPENLEVVGARSSAQASGIGSIEQARVLQMNAPNLINVMPQSEIEKVPNYVLGDAARRLPGASVINKSGESRSIQIRGLDPNLNGVTFEDVILPAGSINGSGRAVPLDAIPAPLAGGLELIKTNRPDQDAFALGGQLNILSRDIGPNDQPFLNISAAGGIRDPHPTRLFDGTIAGGMRFGLDGNPFDKHGGGDRPFSVSFFATALSDWLMLDDLQQKWAGTPGQGVPVKQADQLMYSGHKVRWGYGGTLGWDVDRHTRIYLKMFDSGIEAPVIKYDLTFKPGKTITMDPTLPGAYTSNSSTSLSMNDVWVHNEERVYKFGGLSDVGRFKLDYWGAWASNFLYTPYSYSASFNNANTVPVYYNNITNALRPTASAMTNLANYNSYTLSSLSNAHQNDFDGEWAGHVGASTRLDVLDVKGLLSFGGGLRMEHVTHNDPQYTYGGVPSANAGAWAGNQTYTLFNGMYNLGTPPGTQYVRQILSNPYPGLRENVAADAITTRQSFIDDNENIYNLYLQYQATWRRFGVLAGVRYEKTDGVYRGIATSVVNGQTQLAPRAVGQEYANLFPSIQLRYNFTDNLIARANWSTAIGRPGFNAVTASQTINYQNASISQGNPNLKPTTGTNFDVDLEYYLPRGGILSAGAFDKEFKNYVVNYTNYVSGYPGIPGLATVSTYANIPFASARGFELNYRQQFTFLPGFWKGFGIGGNMTFVDSRGRSRNGVFETLPNTASHIYNFEVFYIHGPLTLQFDGNYQGLTMTGLGSVPNQDSFVQPYLNFDVGARYAITRNFQLYFQGRNITNTMQNATQGSSSKNMVELQYYGSSYLFGLNAKF